MNNILKGVIAITVTPRDENGEVSRSLIHDQIQFLRKSGLSGDNGALVVTGSIGECAALKPEEHRNAWLYSVEAAEGEIPIIAGVNHTNLDLVFEMADEAKNVGADMIMLMSPYYWKPSEYFLEKYWHRVINTVKLPLFIYNNIPVTQIDLSFNIIKELSESDNVHGLKECSPDFNKMQRVIKLKDKINIINGRAERWEPYASIMGCTGFVSGLVNFAPQKSLAIWEAIKNKDYERVNKIKDSLDAYFEFFREKTEKYGMSVEPEILKTSANLVGIKVGDVKPLTQLNSSEKDELKEALNLSGLL